MGKTTLLLCLILLFSFGLLKSQSADSNDIRKMDSINKIKQELAQQLENLENSVKEMEKKELLERYNASNTRGIRSKMLSSGPLRSEPSPNSMITVASIPQNEIVFAYKYMKDDRCWLINYKENWGFVEDNLIMAFREQETGVASSKWDEPPRVKTNIVPKYPKEAEDKKIEGSVVVKIYIDKKGNVTETIILEGIRELNSAAIEAINKARFTPAKLNGKPIGVWVPISIDFKIK